MKKTIIAISLIMFICSSAYAGRVKKSSRIKRGKRGNFYSSTTKMSSTGFSHSTSGKKRKITIKATLNRFVAYNLDNLSIDIAKGSGEYLEALAEIVDVSSQDKETFFHNLKTNFDIIFPSAETDYKYVVAEINRISRTS